MTESKVLYTEEKTDVEEPLLAQRPDWQVWSAYDPDQELMQMYKRLVSAYWTVDEVDLAQDFRDFQDKLNDGERHFLKHVLAFFAASDGLVNENLVENFYSEVTDCASRLFYAFQIAGESVHTEMYAALLKVLIPEQEEQRQLFGAIQHFDAVKKKADWAQKWTNNQIPFAERLVAWAVVEGVLFSGSFCSIFFMKKRGVLPGLCFSNELISRDEGMHCDFACCLFDRLVSKPTPERVLEIVEEAVATEVEFCCEALPVSLLGMNSESMKEYIYFVADRLLVRLGCDKYYRCPNPFTWMELISLQGKTNFFEKRNGEYQKFNVGVSEEDKQFSLDEEF